MKKVALVVTIILAVCSLLPGIVGGIVFRGALERMAGNLMGSGIEQTAQPDATEIAPAPATPEATPVPTPVLAADRVEMERTYENDKDCATIHAYAGSKEIWTCVLPPEPSTELDSFAPIGIVNGQYLYCAVGTVRALDLATGEVVWENSDFGGALAAFDSDENGNIYLTGVYGPDFFMMDRSGKTVKRMDTINDAYYWPIGIEKLPENAVEVIFSMNDVTEEGEYRIRIDLDSWGCQVQRPAVQVDMRAWREAYAEEIYNEGEEYAGYLLINVGMDVPVLYRNGSTTAQGDAVSIYDPNTGAVNSYRLGVDSLVYIPGQNLLREEYGRMDDFGDTIFRVADGDFEVIAFGEYSYDDDDAEYEWMGQHVSEREYEQKLNAVFPTTNAAYACNETWSRRAMLDQLVGQ